ncbi:MAG: 1,4-dihydroxy-6-naphthoate synthase [Spirochaetes bacterium]|jgi:1,4-dihydroxy-6-naphthoate synthase|nr:1,4-dihydroxy-6-naphthoate synthase [Spirochaetota bacterium]
MAAESVPFGFSPCPNDTYAFHAMQHGRVDTGGYHFVSHIDDVESLNHAARRGTYKLSKLSFHAYLHLAGRYTLLDAGSALGFGCGPLVVARSALADLEGARIAIPGEMTTAYLLFRLWNRADTDIRMARFDEILEGVAGGRFDAGLIIHEGRFVYPRFGLEKIVDLGEWWEAETGLPIPLGCIAMRVDGGDYDRVRVSEFTRIIRASVRHALDNPEDSRGFVRAHAREMDDDVVRRHIGLYVNDFTLDLGETGRRAIQTLEEMARCRGILEPA